MYALTVHLIILAVIWGSAAWAVTDAIRARKR